MKIASAASAFPAHHYSQRALVQAFLQHWAPLLAEPRKLELLHHNVGVEGRHLALPIERYPDLTFGQANDAWIDTAQKLGETVVRKALDRAGLEPRDLGAIFFVSVTGISSPSIDAKLVNRLGLSPQIRRTPIFGLGCVAGAAGISRAADYVKAYPDQHAVLVSVELCSLTIQKQDISVANLISSGLFGDGAAAVIVSGDQASVGKPAGPQIVDTRSVFYPDTEDVMGWAISETGFRIILSAEVPNVIASHVREDAEALLAPHGLRLSDVGTWILHTGGPKILRATQNALGLGEDGLAASWDCLRRMGNLSSASVLIVLEEILEHRRPEPGSWSILAAMGPGFCSEMVLLKW